MARDRARTPGADEATEGVEMNTPSGVDPVAAAAGDGVGTQADHTGAPTPPAEAQEVSGQAAPAPADAAARSALDARAEEISAEAEKRENEDDQGTMFVFRGPLVTGDGTTVLRTSGGDVPLGGEVKLTDEEFRVVSRFANLERKDEGGEE